MDHAASIQPSIGIRRESKNRWERRCALAPSHVQELVRKGIRVVVQPSTLRTYPDRKYQEAGAVIDEDLSSCELIVGVKEVPIDQLMSDKTYMFFSHTIKAQPQNMPALDEIRARNIRLIDYEKITDGSNQRLVRFGRFAGYAGMVDTLHAIGDRWLALGYSTPFLHLGYSYVYSSLEAAKDAVRALGEELATLGMPKELGPIIFGFTSNGTSSRGAQEIFNLLPHKWIKPEEVAALAESPDYDRFIVYGTVIEAEHHIVPNDSTKSYDKKDYYTNPQNYHSEFASRFGPYLSIIMNCAYWDSKYPRIFTINQLKEITQQKRCRLVAVGDIACDPLGSIEFLMRTTSIDAPLFVYDPLTNATYDQAMSGEWMYKPGVLMLGVDNLPTEFPREATTYFGDNLLPFMEAIVRSDRNKSYEDMANDLPKEVYRAVITAQGKLTTPFEYIAEWRKRNVDRDRRVLVLGAGHVSRPCVSYLARDPSNIITIADVSVENAQAVARSVHISARESEGPVRLHPIQFDVSDAAALSDLVARHHIVVSLLPRPLNPPVIKACVEHKKNFVCSSYLSDDIRAFDEDAKKAGIIVLNECGLDPGIDHMSSMELIGEIKARQGKVRSFISWCGALPAPECSGNPLGYKFSWSPRGMLQAAVADAKYKLLGHEVRVDGQELFKRVQPVTLFPGLALEGVPNRNSVQYMKEYGIEDVHTIFRGTLRYKGFAEVMEALVDLGLLSEATRLPYLDPSAPKLTWAEFMTKYLDPKGQSGKSPEQLVKDHLRPPPGFPSLGFEVDKLNRVLEAFDYLGLYSDSIYVTQRHTPLDALCPLLEKTLAFDHKVDWDAIIMHHIVEADFPDGHSERHHMTFSSYGKIGGPSAISMTVGLTVAIAADLVMDGTITSKGVLGPMMPDIFVSVMDALRDEGFRFVHRIKTFPTSQTVIA